jgi:hypothetical protein
MGEEKKEKKTISLDITDPATAVFFARLIDLGAAEHVHTPNSPKNKITASLDKNDKGNLIIKVHSDGLMHSVHSDGLMFSAHTDGLMHSAQTGGLMKSDDE